MGAQHTTLVRAWDIWTLQVWPKEGTESQNYSQLCAQES